MSSRNSQLGQQPASANHLLYSVEQMELIRRLRLSGITAEGVIEAFRELEQVEADLDDLHNQQQQQAAALTAARLFFSPQPSNQNANHTLPEPCPLQIPQAFARASSNPPSDSILHHSPPTPGILLSPTLNEHIIQRCTTTATTVPQAQPCSNGVEEMKVFETSAQAAQLEALFSASLANCPQLSMFGTNSANQGFCSNAIEKGVNCSNSPPPSSSSSSGSANGVASGNSNGGISNRPGGGPARPIRSQRTPLNEITTLDNPLELEEFMLQGKRAASTT
uniref:HNF-p1 domain-containing protein n=1 Tax=Ditylenchus dipsaci TaxID=166011 RepID=A0A915ENI3_9BILA